ncbi:MAG: DsbE family thiol:disulfide interchange protein [Hyphomicrobiaceae bacterium]|nr:DsbE family thiol:disulfide interchange protein [Hyphomicrobiaceae bacterium]
MSRWAAVGPVMIFAVVALAFGFALRLDPHKLPSMLIDKPPPRFSLPPVEGTSAPLDSSKLQGQVMLLNIYASWCPGCRLEHPTLMRIAREKVVPLYGLNWKDKPGQGGRWLRQYQNPYIAVGDDPSGRAGIEMGVTGVPETFVIDTAGRIRYRHAGPVTEEVWQEVFVPLLASLGVKS